MLFSGTEQKKKSTNLQTVSPASYTGRDGGEMIQKEMSLHQKKEKYHTNERENPSLTFLKKGL